jgi:hypothetical protein
VIEHVPAATIVTALPATVQTAVVVEAKLTVSPELAEALIENGDTPATTLPICPNVIVCDSGLTVKLWITGVAAAKFGFPAWLAVIVQVPAATILTTVPATVQTPVVPEVRLTVSPELAVALSENGTTPKLTPVIEPKLIVSVPMLTVKLWTTAVAALYVELPAWFAVMEQVPRATIVTVLPETVQTATVVEDRLTASPEVAVALTVKGAAPNAMLLSAPKLIVWFAVMEKLCVAGVAVA